MSIEGIIAIVIFLASLYLVFSEKLHRTVAGMLGALLMILAGKILGFFNEAQALASVDFNTLGLLLGMMLLVAILEPTGFFEFLAVYAARLSRGNPVRLLIFLGSVTTVLSMFLDNVTTVVLIAPVTILISEILGINPSPLLIAEALLSNTGGVATLVGDPPNVLIASAADFTFADFLTHSLPIVVIVWILTLVLIRYMFRKELDHQPENVEAILKLKPADALKNRSPIWKTLIVLALAIVLFFLEEALNISPAFIALGAAVLALVWARPDTRQALHRVEWSVLIFFAALFVMVGGLESAGVLHMLSGLILQLGNTYPVLLGILILWVVAILSAVVDNVPITIALIPVILELGDADVAIAPLWWALAFGAGFGGNATIIGSTANVVIASLSEKTRSPITGALWIKIGLPVMLATCAITSILYVILYPLLAK